MRAWIVYRGVGKQYPLCYILVFLTYFVRRWHTLIAVSLGISWIMDGLIVSSLSLVGSKLLSPDTLALTPGEVGWSGTTYLIGAVLGALLFGYLADRYGRQRLFIVTPTIYLLASQGAAFSWDFWSFIACTFLIGLGIGGEYSAMNSAINEVIFCLVLSL